MIDGVTTSVLLVLAVVRTPLARPVLLGVVMSVRAVLLVTHVGLWVVIGIGRLVLVVVRGVIWFVRSRRRRTRAPFA